MRPLAVTTAALILTACGSSSQQPPVATVTVTAPDSQSSNLSTAVAVPTTVSTPAPTGPKTVIENDGTYLVGTDIAPGTYRTTGGSSCYWARLDSLDTSDIIDNHNSSGPQVIEILPSDRAFLTEDCQTWTLESSLTTASPRLPAQSPAPLPNPRSGESYEGMSCSHRAALTLRTAQSAVLICDEGSGVYTYKGLRLKDGARIDLAGVVPTATGFTVTNNGTRYDISSGGLVIYTDGQVYPEPALASGP